MNENLSDADNERTLALLGLAASRSPVAGECPSDETLAAFIDHRLRGQDHKAMLAHLNRCSSCYHRWLEVDAYLDSLMAVDAARQATPRAGRWQRLGAWLSSWKLAVPMAAVATVIALVVLWSPSPDLEGRIDADYAAAIARDSTAFAQTARAFSLPWEEQPLGFSEANLSASKRAFGAGLWVGRAELLGTTPEPLPAVLSAPGKATWAETEWADYYALGRWMMLVWTVARSGQRVEDWQSYPSTAQALRANLKQREATDAEAAGAVATLSDLEPLLGALAQPSGGPGRNELSRHLQFAIHQLAP